MTDDQISKFNAALTPAEKQTLDGLVTPFKISMFLDTVQYAVGERNRSVINVLRERQAHCLDGGLFAAAMLARLGFPAVIIDLLPDPGMDDDHVLAIFKQNNCWGCVAKSNYTGLRYRDPVYRSLRELVMSYFDVFFDDEGNKTLRGYTRPIQLKAFDHYHWLVEDHAVNEIEKHMKTLTTTPLFTPEMVRTLVPVDERSYLAGLSGRKTDVKF